jgi:hypothetical protein
MSEVYEVYSCDAGQESDFLLAPVPPSSGIYCGEVGGAARALDDRKGL